MNGIMPHTTTSTELQRHFKRVINRVKKLKEPVAILSKNKPSVVLMDYNKFNQMQTAKKAKKPLFGIWNHLSITSKEIDKVVRQWDSKIDQLTSGA